MKPILLLCLCSVLAPAIAPAATSTIDFGGAIATTSGPGSMAAFGGLTTAFNTVSGFGLAAMTGGNRQVMSFSGQAAANGSGLQFTHATPSPNTTGYSILMDVYFTSVPNYLSLLQLNNADDGDLFARSTGAVGINSDYGGTAFTAGSWHRLVATVDNTLTTAFLNIYVDGTAVNSVDAFASSPDRFDLSEPSFMLFADEDGETGPGYISQFGFSDRVFSPAEITALGGASAAVIPEPSGLLLSAGTALGLMLRRRRA